MGHERVTHDSGAESFSATSSPLKAAALPVEYPDDIEFVHDVRTHELVPARHLPPQQGIVMMQNVTTGEPFPATRISPDTVIQPTVQRRTGRRGFIRGAVRAGAAIGLVGAPLGGLALAEPEVLHAVGKTIRNIQSEDATPIPITRHLDNSPDYQPAMPEGTPNDRDPLKGYVEANGEFIISDSTIEFVSKGKLAGAQLTYTPVYPDRVVVRVKEVDEDGNQKYDEHGNRVTHPASMTIKDGKILGDSHDFQYPQGISTYEALTLFPTLVDTSGQSRSSIRLVIDSHGESDTDTFDYNFPVHVQSEYRSRTGEQSGNLMSQIPPEENVDIPNLLTLLDSHFSPFVNMDIIPHVFLTRYPTNYEVEYPMQKPTDVPEMGFVYHPLEVVGTPWDLNSSYDMAKGFVEAVQGRYGARHHDLRQAEINWFNINNYLREQGLKLYPPTSNNPGESPVPAFMRLFMPDRYNPQFMKTISPYSNFPSVSDQDRFAEWFTSIKHNGEQIVGPDGNGGLYADAVASKPEEKLLAQLYFTSCYQLFNGIVQTPDAEAKLIPQIANLKKTLLMPDEQYLKFLSDIS